MRKSTRVISATIGVALLLGILGAGVAFAQTPTPSAATDWQSTFLGKVATILGVDQQELSDAMQQAAKETRDEQIDAAVASGRLTQEYADWLRQRPDDGRRDLNGFGLGFGRVGPHGGKFGGRMIDRFGGQTQPQSTPAPTESS